MSQNLLKFDPQNLFPLLDEAACSYQEAQAHSALVDEALGLRTEAVEAKLVRAEFEKADQEVQAWIGLPVQTLLTPYTELRLLLERLKLRGDESIIDLGAGYGRLAFVMGEHFPLAKFCGYELVNERVQEGLRALSQFQYPNVDLKTQDLSAVDFVLPEADIYFLYDFGSRSAIEKTLQDLRAIAAIRTIRVVGRGRASRDAIERDHPWLAQVNAAKHFAHYSIYSS